MYLVLNFKSNLGTYEHDLLAYERDARGRKFASGVNLLSGADLHPGANCAHEHGFSQLLIQPIVWCTCPHFVWCMYRILTEFKVFMYWKDPPRANRGAEPRSGEALQFVRAGLSSTWTPKNEVSIRLTQRRVKFS